MICKTHHFGQNDGISSSETSGRLTQDCHDDVVFQDFDGAAGHKVESRQHVSTVHQRVSRRSVGRLEPHGQRPQAALRGSTERLTALEEALVEMEANVRLQAFWETLQHLGAGTGRDSEKPGNIWGFFCTFL